MAYNINEVYPPDPQFWNEIYPNDLENPKDATHNYSNNLINWAWNKSKIKMMYLADISRQKAYKMWMLAFYNGYLCDLFSGYRSFDHQKELYDLYHEDPVNNNIAAPPGRSYHNYGMAWDIMIMNYKGTGALPGGTLKLESINVQAGLNLTWGGYFTHKDPYHFADKRFTIDELQEMDDFKDWEAGLDDTTADEMAATEEILEEYKNIQVERADKSRKAWMKKNIYWLVPLILGAAAGLVYLGVLAWKREKK